MAKVVRRVVIATGGMGYPIILVGASAWETNPRIFANNWLDILYGDGWKSTALEPERVAVLACQISTDIIKAACWTAVSVVQSV